MNTYLFMAASFSVVLVFAHSLLGEIKIFSRMKNEGLPVTQGIPLLFGIPSATKRILRFVWHIPSVLGLGIACIVFYFSGLPSCSGSDVMVIKMIAAAMLASGLLTLLFTKASHMGWIIFAIIGTCCLLGI